MSNRILFLTPGLGKGGAETQMVKIAFFLKRQGMDVLIVSLKPINDFSFSSPGKALDVIFLKQNWLINFIPNLYSLVKITRRYKPNVVISFMFIAIIFGRLLKMVFGFKLISSIRNSQISKKWVYFFKITSGLDDVIVYNSNASKINFESRELALQNGVVIRNAIDIPPSSSLMSSENEVFKWICIAHFRITKDYPTLFKAISLLKNYNFKVEIVGRLNGLKWPFQTIADLGIQHHVNILDFQPDPAKLLKQSDALVLSSFFEGMPNAVLEAMAYAKPVVASDIDGVNELIRDSCGGLLFKAGDENDLAKKMIATMEMNLESRRTSGMAGREFIINNFDQELIFHQWLKLINRYIKNH